MTCKGVLEVLSDYLEGDAGREMCKMVEEHLKGCKRCRMHVDAMKKVVIIYKKWRDEEIPDDVSTRLQTVFAREYLAGSGHLLPGQRGPNGQSPRTSPESNR